MRQSSSIANLWICLLLALLALISCGSGGVLVRTAASPTDIGGLEGHRLGSYDSELQAEQWTRRELGRTVSYKQDYTLKLGQQSYSGELKLTYRNGPLVSAAVTFMLMDRPAEEVSALYDALEQSLRAEYDKGMFRAEPPAPDASGSLSLELHDDQRDYLQLLSSGGLVDLSIQAAE
jgi:hypothetical protein